MDKAARLESRPHYRPLLGTMANSRKVVPYVDIPIQHCAPAILKAMGRPPDGPERVSIRSAPPSGRCIGTSIMVGFPGETRAEFKSLFAFMERIEFVMREFLSIRRKPDKGREPPGGPTAKGG